MKKIRAYVGYSYTNKIHFYKDFEIVSYLPECKEVKEVELDAEQGRDEVYNYDYFECLMEDGEYKYYAIDKFEKKDFAVKTYPTNIDVFVYKYNHISKESEQYTFTLDIDGIEFEDEEEMNEFVSEWLIENVESEICLSEDDSCEIFNDITRFLDSKITRE